MIDYSFVIYTRKPGETEWTRHGEDTHYYDIDAVREDRAHLIYDLGLEVKVEVEFLMN